jgi:hypothetical protein
VGDDRPVVVAANDRGRAARSFVVATAMAAVAVVFSCCAGEQKALGEACIKAEDCLSGVCSDGVCIAAPPLLDGGALGDALDELPADAHTDAFDARKPGRDTGDTSDTSEDVLDAAEESTPDVAPEAPPADEGVKDSVAPKDGKSPKDARGGG